MYFLLVISDLCIYIIMFLSTVLVKLKRHVIHCTPNEINEIKRFVEAIPSERIEVFSFMVVCC